MSDGKGYEGAKTQCAINRGEILSVSNFRICIGSPSVNNDHSLNVRPLTVKLFFFLRHSKKIRDFFTKYTKAPRGNIRCNCGRNCGRNLASNKNCTRNYARNSTRTENYARNFQVTHILADVIAGAIFIAGQIAQFRLKLHRILPLGAFIK